MPCLSSRLVLSSLAHVAFVPVLALVAVGCSSRQSAPADPSAEPASAEAASSEPAASEPAAPEPDAASDASAPDAPSGEASSEPAAPAAPLEPLGALCNKMCDAVAPKCTEVQLEGCKKTCKNYERVPDVCEPSARTALECARSDRDFLFCANVVPITCAKQFKTMDTCVATGVAPVVETKKAIPDGWARYQAPDGAFSAVLPKGVETKTEGGIQYWTVKTDDGGSYEITKRPAPTEAKWDNRSFLRLSRTLFGRCSDKMRLKSLIEKPGHSSMQYSTVCPDKTEQHGGLHVVGSDLYVLALRFAPGAKPEIDPFVYGFLPGK